MTRRCWRIALFYSVAERLRLPVAPSNLADARAAWAAYHVRTCARWPTEVT